MPKQEILFEEEQVIQQLEMRKGGYFYLTIPAEFVNRLEQKRYTRFICTIEENVTFQCGLNHLGDGNFFIILGSKNLKAANKKLGNTLHFTLQKDPNPLGVAMPEVLEALLEQDDTLKAIFEKLSMGKKRHVIHSINKIKDIDKQINAAIRVIHEQTKPRKRNL
ncbi:MAG: YdeI/OmpD-associated family protein [Cyclobacteriaceae bacterium]